METINEILQYNFSYSSFKQSAEKIIPIRLSSLIELKINKLEQISQEVGLGAFTFSGKNLIPQIFKKFKSSLSDSNIRFEPKELRTLSYSLAHSEQGLTSILSNDKELDIALGYLASNWKDTYLFGLIDCLLQNWEATNDLSLVLLEYFITSKLEGYEGGRNTLISFKANKKYFNTNNGDLILGDTLAKLNIPLGDACKFLGVPTSWNSYPYFSKVIVTYYERNKNKISEVLNNLVDFLVIHNKDKTYKRLISKLIIQANQPEFVNIQDDIKVLAFNYIGDPNNNSNWLPLDNFSTRECEELLQSKNILNEWLTRQFINVFFNECINDERRKKFWLKYVTNITSFKVYGSSITKAILKNNESIAEFLDARFEVVSSNVNLSAFLLFIDNHMIIEFSNDGYACCAYKIGSKNAPDLNRHLNSIDSLRNSSLDLAIQTSSNYYYNLSEEGRLLHNADWEHKFNYWLKSKVLR
jgi:hypothetical protein